MRKRHFLIYYDNRVKEIIKTTPRTWAKANQGHFPQHNFNQDHPTDKEIESYLEHNYGFTVDESNSDFVITYRFDQIIPPANQRNFIL